MKRITIGLLLLFAVAFTGFSWAQESPSSRTMGPGMMGSGHGMRGFPQALADRPLITFMLEHKKELSLSADQVRSLEAIRSAFQQEALQRIAEIDSAEVDLEGLLKQAPVDLALVESTLRKIEALRATLRLDRIKAVSQGKSLLSLEQQERLQALLEQGGPPSGRRRG